MTRKPFGPPCAPFQGTAPLGLEPGGQGALDFQFDTIEDNRTLKLPNISEEFTRECPAIVVGRSSVGPQSVEYTMRDRSNAIGRMSRPPWNFGDGHRLMGYAATSFVA